VSGELRQRSPAGDTGREIVPPRDVVLAQAPAEPDLAPGDERREVDEAGLDVAKGHAPGVEPFDRGLHLVDHGLDPRGEDTARCRAARTGRVGQRVVDEGSTRSLGHLGQARSVQAVPEADELVAPRPEILEDRPHVAQALVRPIEGVEGRHAPILPALPFAPPQRPLAILRWMASRIRRPAALAVLALAVAACGGLVPAPGPTVLPGGAATPAAETREPASSPALTPPPLDPTPDGAGCVLPALDVRVAQLLLVGIAGTEPTGDSLDLVRSGVGGVVLLGSNLLSGPQVAALVAGLQAAAPLPLVVAIDEEPGRIGRLARVGIIEGSPSARDLGKESADTVRATARLIGEALASLGITTDLAPVLDVTGAAAGGVIGDRSFGSSPSVVTRAGGAFMAGLADAGVASVVKHFPGHGESTVDSHTSLPKVGASLATLRKRALPPFVAAIQDGIRAVMVGHLLVLAVDEQRPASLSRAVIQGLLRDDLGFDGLVMSDDLVMGALDHWGGLPRRTELAISAGVDMAIVLDERAIPGVIAGLLDAVASGRLAETRVDEAFLRVVRFKGLPGYEGCSAP
jgi:beta-N-acetylhexosaminidase